MKHSKNTYGIDTDYLRANRQSTPEQRLNWLVAAQEFTRAARTSLRRMGSDRLKTTEKPHQ